MSARVTFADIVLLIIAAGIAGFITVVLAKSYSLSPFMTAILAASVNSIGWIAGYQVLSRSRGWDNLQIRFSAIGGRVVLASAAGAVALMLLLSALAIFLNGLGIKMTDIRPTVVMPNDLGQRVAAWPAIVLISLLFAFLHNNSLSTGLSGWLIWGHRFLLGVRTSLLALQYKSLRAPFVLHATNNGIACVVSALFPIVKAS